MTLPNTTADYAPLNWDRPVDKEDLVIAAAFVDLASTRRAAATKRLDRLTRMQDKSQRPWVLNHSIEDATAQQDEAHDQFIKDTIFFNRLLLASDNADWKRRGRNWFYTANGLHKVPFPPEY